MKKTLSVGILAGIISMILYYLLSGLTEFKFTMLNPTSIMIVSIIVNLIGALIFTKLRRKTARPALIYGFIIVGAALLLSLLDWAYPPEPHVGDIANPIHAIVATISIVLIPRWLRNKNNR